MTKQNTINREYIVVEGDGFAIGYADTRAQARNIQQSLGGAKAGIKILQQFIVQREVR